MNGVYTFFAVLIPIVGLYHLWLGRSRTEEPMGSALDLWTADREGAFNIWRKIPNPVFAAKMNSKCLGKPYEPNAIPK